MDAALVSKNRSNVSGSILDEERNTNPYSTVANQRDVLNENKKKSSVLLKREKLSNDDHRSGIW
ncbi:hypothetical protein V1477_000694 [Vespula maculifrons]|uniref:Uncharacterized protein n=1 Tax=Vespula maculifrons TaxID=7453 RepID=A0ABD2D2E0_VESMC